MFDTPDETHTGLSHDLPPMVGNVPMPATDESWVLA